MSSLISILIFIIIVGLPYALNRRNWTIPSIATLTGSIAGGLVQLYDIIENGIDYGPLNFGPIIYVIRFLTVAFIIGLGVTIVLGLVRKKRSL